MFITEQTKTVSTAVRSFCYISASAAHIVTFPRRLCIDVRRNERRAQKMEINFGLWLSWRVFFMFWSLFCDVFWEWSNVFGRSLNIIILQILICMFMYVFIEFVLSVWCRRARCKSWWRGPIWQLMFRNQKCTPVTILKCPYLKWHGAGFLLIADNYGHSSWNVGTFIIVFTKARPWPRRDVLERSTTHTILILFSDIRKISQLVPFRLYGENKYCLPAYYVLSSSHLCALNWSRADIINLIMQFSPAALFLSY